MALKDTVLARVVTFLRVELEEDVTGLSGSTTLGDDLGFSPGFIDDEFRRRIEEWFGDLKVDVGAGTWDESSDLSGVSKDLIDASSISTAPAYRAHVILLTEAAWDEEIGSETIPVLDRPKARDALNDALRTLLLRDVALSDLSGSREAILPRLIARMIV
jgi:hypothetical protein